MQWHEAMPQRWNQEQSIASTLLEGFEAGIDGSGCAFVRGLFNVVSEHGHVYEAVKLRITYPPNFPARNQPPSAYLESHRDRWEKGGDSHIESDWRLCLFVPGESGIDFGEASSLNDFLAVTHTFLFKQRVYQRRLVRSRLDGTKAEWPGKDRSHGLQGIREAVQDAGGIGRNEPCPCGSGKKFKRCHLGKLLEAHVTRRQ